MPHQTAAVRRVSYQRLPGAVEAPAAVENFEAGTASPVDVGGEDGREVARRANFIKSRSGSGAGGYLVDQESGLGYHVTGTDPRTGRYIPPHVVNNRWQTVNAPGTPPRALLRDQDQLVDMLDLIPVSGRYGVYTRRGFNGYYVMQTENDGTLSVFYTGGRHQQAGAAASQTFHHGQWDLRRNRAGQIVTPPPPPQSARVEVTPVSRKTPAEESAAKPRPAETISQPAIPPPAVLGELAEKVTPPPQTLTEKVVEAVTPKLTWPSQNIGDYHVPSAGARERTLIDSVLSAAEKVLPEGTKQQLRKAFTSANLEQGSQQVRELFRKTLSAVNEVAAQHSSLDAASDSLRKKLGLPEGTKVYLALSGGGTFGLSEEQVSDALDRAFGDSIRIRGFRPALATASDIVVLQASRERGHDPLFLSMSVVSVYGTEPNKWQVATHEATYRAQTHAHVFHAVDRNPNERVESLPEWREKREKWFKTGGLLDAAVASGKEQQAEQIRLAAEETKRIEARAAESAKQSATFAQVSKGHWRMGYQDNTISEFFSQNAAFRAAETRTGTFRVQPDAGLHFEVTDAKGETKRVNLNSIEQLKKMSAAERELFEYALTTPYEKDHERAIRRIVDLFPADVYRPGWSASFVYSPRYYGREIITDILPEYLKLKTPEERRKFLGNLLQALKKEEYISASSIAHMPASLFASR